MNGGNSIVSAAFVLWVAGTVHAQSGAFPAAQPTGADRVIHSLANGGPRPVTSAGVALPIPTATFAPGFAPGAVDGFRPGLRGFHRRPVFFGPSFISPGFLPLYPTYYPYNYGYTYPSAYDPALAGLQDQNERLRRQLDAVEQQNQQLRDAKQNPPFRQNIPLRPKPADQQAAERERINEARAKQLIASGSRLFAAGSYARAAERYREAIKATAKDASPYFMLAQALFANKRYAEAAQAIKDGLKINPDWVELDFDMRKLYSQPQDLIPQLASLARELQANPLDRTAMYVLGFELFVTGQKDKAKTILEQSARLEADDSHLKPFFDYFEKLAAANARQG